MDSVEELRNRVELLEEKLDVCVEVINHLVEVLYEPEFVKKLDKLASYGETGEQEG